ncbi:MAG: hypothetical protein IJN65_05630 [Clostridia bacterium]|nr:hypothetical protein [Clostridia bacterium]
MEFFDFKNENFKYSGVWQESVEKDIVSYGSATFVEVGFTGEKIEVVGFVSGMAEFFINGELTSYEKIADGFAFAVENGKHTLKIRIRRGRHIHFKGVRINEGEALFKTQNKPYIHYIGDSITDAYPGFAEGSALSLSVDYSIVSQGGMALTDGWGWYAKHPKAKIRRGMESTYFGLEFGDEAESLTPYKFEYLRMPDVVVVFLGTNDYLDAPIDEERGNLKIFAENYLAFVKKLRALYPAAPIFMLQALSDKYCRVRGIAGAFELINENVENVHLVPSNEWGVEISADGTHPSSPGFRFMGEKLAEVLADQLEKMGLR